MVNNDCASSTIPICNVTGRTLVMVIEWWNKHEIGAVSNEMELKEWESQFFISDDKSGRDDVYNLLIAANHLNIPGLLERCACAVVEAVKGQSMEEIDTVKIFMQDRCGGLLLVRVTKSDNAGSWVVSIVDRLIQNKLECIW
ncbi:hypothetical protein LWI29_016614 [Acer saccharum]|uniref:SKP1 component POZ domain-containing protein n=1 Tax=Acer saccharum TaxID=4024 RepID=A0AA39SSS6_ACESA|nr:hypothetical protein LWI29_016614 [Acer saccharum]